MIKMMKNLLKDYENLKIKQVLRICKTIVTFRERMLLIKWLSK